MTRWSLTLSWPALVIGLLFLAAAAWLSVQQYRRTGARKMVLALETLRWVIVLLLFLSLLQPEMRRRLPPRNRPEVVVLCDQSRSMTTQDVVTPSNMLTRADWLEQQRASLFWKPLEARYEVKVEDFARPLTNAADSALEEGTDINAALERTLTGNSGLRAVVVLSDGDWNLGKSPVTAATRYQLGGVPIFTIGVGSEQHLPDLALTDVAVPAYGLVGEQVFIPFTVSSHLGRDVKTRVQLLAGGTEANFKDIVIPAHGRVQDGVMWFPQRSGATELTLQFPVEREELRVDNNRQSFAITVRSETLRVLVIDSLPRWEYRFLRNALSRDPVVEVKCLLFHPGMNTGSGRDYIESFPETKDQLSVFDVVFLGDVGIGEKELTREQADLLKGLVEQQGSGLVFIPGRRGRQATFEGTGLEGICPVLYDKSKPAGITTLEPASLGLTKLGRNHLLTMLANNEEANAFVWRTLPGFSWCAGVERSRPGADVLGVHESYANKWGRIPLLVTRPAGNGKTLFLGTDSAWKWRRGVEDLYHYRFWGQVVRWMSYQRHRAHDEGFRIAFAPDAPSLGETVTIVVTAFDPSGLPLNDAKVVLDLTTPKGLPVRQTLTSVPGGWGVYQGQFAAEQRGKYGVKVFSEQTRRSMQTEIEVRGVVLEQTGQPARTDVLKEISGITSGQYAPPEELTAFINTLVNLPEPEPVERRLRIWSHPLWGCLIFVMIVVYWVGRKLGGLV